MQLSDIIIERIHKEGPISFKDFMEMALYYPELGYYNSNRSRIGPDGDFYTSANLSDAFGAMIARQLEEMWLSLGQKPLKIVEYGAGTGLLSYDILAYLKNNPHLYENLSYCIIEKSSAMQEIQKTHLKEKVTWYQCIQDIPEINGCILSNELVDNFSINQVVMEDQLMEIFVDYSNGFIEVLQPANRELTDYFLELGVHLAKGFRTEINTEAISWIKEIALSLNKGYVITIDYGCLSSELYDKHRSFGTLICYYKHDKNNNPYQFIGEQDITAHVNFSALSHWGNKYGLNCCGITDQASFLLNLGIKDYQNSMAIKTENSAMKAIQESVINYRLLIDMGIKYKVMIQEKNVSKYLLSGLKKN